MKTESTKVIGKVFQEIADAVTPTMGSKGRMAVLAQDMDRPLITDDGVTVARMAWGYKGFEKLPAFSMIEAAVNTEKEAYDGTTLTVLLTNELYKLGLNLIKPIHKGGLGYHPQKAADSIAVWTDGVREHLKEYARPLTQDDVYNLATIVTKIPEVGKIIQEIYKQAGPSMNVMIEHNREDKSTNVEKVKGLVLESGYMLEIIGQAFCNAGKKTEFENARLVLLGEDMMTKTSLLNFFKSIPSDKIGEPLVFVITPKFNPESLQMLLKIITDQKDKLKAQFISLNEEHSDELYLDIAAYTGGKVQDAALGTSDYTYDDCGTADKIVIEQYKTIIEASGNTSARRESYEDSLKKSKFNLSTTKEAMIRRRLSNLESGLTKVKLVAASVIEYNTIRMKLDDAIGAVRIAGTHGIVPGGGRVLADIANRVPMMKRVLQAPMKTILQNAGASKRFIKKALKSESIYDVNTMSPINKDQSFIIDGFASVDVSLKNAASIASNYLRAYILIQEK